MKADREKHAMRHLLGASATYLAPNRSSFSSLGRHVKFANDRFVIPEVSMCKISRSLRSVRPAVPASVISVPETSSAFKYLRCLHRSRRPASVRAVSASTSRSRCFKRQINSIPLRKAMDCDRRKQQQNEEAYTQHRLISRVPLQNSTRPKIKLLQFCHMLQDSSVGFSKCCPCK